LVLHEHIKTTEAKAKEVRPLVERLVTKSKEDKLANRRQVARLLDKGATKKIFSDIGPRYLERPGGYTRITKLHKRKDDAQMVKLEFV